MGKSVVQKVSQFRKLQNEIVSYYFNNSAGSIVEFGADKINDYKYLSNGRSYLTTNIAGSVDKIEDLTNLSFASNSLECTLCISVLQHIYNFNLAIDEIIRVLRPGGTCLITNGFYFPICMEMDYFRFTPEFWKRRLQDENVEFEIILMGNKYISISDLLMRPYGYYKGFSLKINKLIAILFRIISIFYKRNDSSPLGIAVIIKKK